MLSPALPHQTVHAVFLYTAFMFFTPKHALISNPLLLDPFEIPHWLYLAIH